MRLKELKLHVSTEGLKVDIMEGEENFAIIVSHGVAKMVKLPLHGETKIITHQGKVKRVKFDEGENF
ncbi:XtrA/YqaO family protein [Bacillus sp. NSP9.1]|uniref:XtrA/YqaO family protein n=1 Tax=Bacillus sp. NSP9.1 TaxID=1071078 RepID=UPI00047BBCD0|nr:XtrA/YqaO family protein [Bacillus sp. NSP9.1]QHZ46352.1 hypothetical protein M654_008620 [Bacillus sp. NSP9.1]